MIDVFIQTRKNIQFVGGYKLQNGMACHKSPDRKEWNIVDLASGLLIKENLTNLKECIDYAKNNPDKEKVEKARKSKHFEDALAATGVNFLYKTVHNSALDMNFLSSIFETSVDWNPFSLSFMSSQVSNIWDMAMGD